MKHARTEVLDWLGEDSSGQGYFLHPKDLIWSKAGPEKDLKVYSKVAERLLADSEYTSEVLRAEDWRLSLVGAVCLLVKNNSNHLDDLQFRFLNGSEVLAPLAVSIALLHPNQYEEVFHSLLDCSPEDAVSQQISTAIFLLECLGNPLAQKLKESWHYQQEMQNPHGILKAHDRARRVQMHFDFWSQRIAQKESS